MCGPRVESMLGVWNAGNFTSRSRTQSLHPQPKAPLSLAFHTQFQAWETIFLRNVRAFGMVGPLLSRYTMHACVLRLSVMSNSLQPHGLYPTRFFCPWDFPGKDTGVGCHFLLQGIFLTQGWSLYLLHWQADSLLLTHLGRPANSVQEPKHSPWPLILQGSPSSQSYASLSTRGTSTSFSLFPLLTAFGVLCDNWCARPAFLPGEEHAGCLDPTLLCLGGASLAVSTCTGSCAQ